MTSPRFGRNFLLEIDVGGNTLEVQPPLRVSFNGQKSIYGGLNKMNFSIYNLSKKSRLELVKDPEERKRIPLRFGVGYGDDLQSIFKGTVHTSSNDRQGSDFITSIESLDGGFDSQFSFTSRSMSGGDVLTEILKDTENTSLGLVSTPRRADLRPKVLVGQSYKLIDDLVGPDENWYIDNEQLFIIKDDDTTTRLVPVVNAKSGLLGVPTRKQRQITFKTTLNPAITLGGLLRLESTIAPHLDGIYRAETMGFSGDNYGTDWTQTITGKLV